MQMKKRDILAKGEMSDRSVRLHNQTIRKNPGKSDVAARMNREAKLFLEKRASQGPREQDAEEHEQLLHNCGVRLR